MTNCDLLIRNGTIVTPEKTFEGVYSRQRGQDSGHWLRSYLNQCDKAD